MRKIIVFVEGQTELIITKQMILQRYEWNVDILCFKLVKDGNLQEVEYRRSANADVHYTIIQVGGDNRLLSEILEREKLLIERGFERVIGLRDMFSEEYNKVSTTIKPEITGSFKKNILQQIEKVSTNHKLIHFCFAIMETEAWLLAMQELLERIHHNLTPDFILKNTGINLAVIDPETYFFHPANDFTRIMELVGLSYDKHAGEVESIAGKTTIEDYEKLYSGDKCASFNPFYDSLFVL